MMLEEKGSVSLNEPRTFSFPYLKDEPYWIIVSLGDAATRNALAPALKTLGTKPLHQDETLVGVKTTKEWVKSWETLAGAVNQADIATSLRVAVLSGEALASHQEIILSLKAFAEIDAIAHHLWLARALEKDRLVCCMQKVFDRRGKVTGYEAFARIEQENGEVVGGRLVMQASHALRLEYQVDRMMHRRAIQCFVEHQLEGFIFINFLTGFIHRPEVYLEGLSQAVEQYQVTPRAVVLDVPLGDYAQHLPKIKTIAQYCRSRGFGLALDDVMKPEELNHLLSIAQPAFVKIHGKLGPAMLDPKRQAAIHDIIRLSREAGATVLAEEIESEALCNAYRDAGVDMFQGYFFGMPERYAPRVAKKARG